MSALPEKMRDHWQEVSPLFTLRNAEDYEHACERLNNLLDDIGEEETHPLYELLNTLGTLVYAYEETHQPMPPCRGHEALRFLMEEHGLGPSDLPEVGEPSVVSAILEGRRELNLRDLRFVSDRFHVSPAVFL